MKNENKKILLTFRPSSLRNVIPQGFCAGYMRNIGAAHTLYPALQACGMTECVARGFTLIELLVVVLIIGILAAVAVPQYRIAVEKSRTIQVFTLLQAIADAEEVYFLANGKYSINYSELDISLPTEVTKDNERLILQNGATISLNTTRYGYVAGGTARTQINYFFNHYSVANAPYYKPGMITCAARTKDNIGLNVCKSLPQAEFFSNTNCSMWGNGAEACTLYTVRR